ncbi:bacterio-opsin activator domain-containing protein [Haloarcula pelagica]|uniref:helix-turn-helix domain-containing protein n=1 Tax=Haloarcula pelagica TaxID=3033389 RepID=UPI0024C2515C|nr:bacterio-opsin activator domain-containing protein [Halomicroarcula sp. YJ-61-S]
MDSHGGDERGATRLEFDLSASTYPFVLASGHASCTISLQQCLPSGDGLYTEFFTVEGADPERFVGFVEDGRGEARVLNRTDDGGLVEVAVGEHCPVVTLADAGAVPRTARGADGNGAIVADVPTATDTAVVIESFLDAHPAAELAAKQQRESIAPLFGFRDYAALTDTLTDRQRDVLATAHEAGYYEWPRETTAEELASRLDISAPTLHKHLRMAERKLAAALLACPHEESALDD